MRIGCHAVMFREQIAEQTSQTLAKLASSGCDGVEIGSRFFGAERNAYLLTELQGSGLELAGLHAVVQLDRLADELDTQRAPLYKCGEFLQIMPNKNIVLTGIMNSEDARFTDPDFLRRMAEGLDRLSGEMMEKYGVQLNYHNHNWEFANNGAVFSALVQYAPRLHFALDTGWAAVSGFDPAELIRTLRGRVFYLHLRDFVAERLPACRESGDFHSAFVNLGEGNMDYKALLKAACDAMGDTGYLVIEYEEGPVDETRYRHAVTYVKEQLAAL